MSYGTSVHGILRRTDTGAEVLDLPYATLDDALRAGWTATGLHDVPARGTLPADRLELLSPVVRPGNVWAVGLAYRKHVAEARSARTKDDPEYPPTFLKAASSVVGTGADIVLPAIAPDEVDYEGEVTVVVGKGGADIEPEDAWDHVFGITAANDVSARDVQFGRFTGGVMDVGKAKSFDTFTPMGPWVVLPEELQDRDRIGLRTVVNGEERQRATTAELIWPIADLLAFVSRFATLSPGDVLLTGTPGGVGRARGLFLRDGDLVEVEVEGVGTLANRVRS